MTVSRVEASKTVFRFCLLTTLPKLEGLPKDRIMTMPCFTSEIDVTQGRSADDSAALASSSVFFQPDTA